MPRYNNLLSDKARHIPISELGELTDEQRHLDYLKDLRASNTISEDEYKSMYEGTAHLTPAIEPVCDTQISAMPSPLLENAYPNIHPEMYIPEAQFAHIRSEASSEAPPNKSYPFTATEDKIMQHLLKAQQLFISLPGGNKNAATDFLSHTRDLRRILSMRIIARNYKDYEVEND